MTTDRALDRATDPADLDPGRLRPRRARPPTAEDRARAEARAALRVAEARATDLARREATLRWSGAPVPSLAHEERAAVEVERRDRAAVLRDLMLTC